MSLELNKKYLRIIDFGLDCLGVTTALRDDGEYIRFNLGFDEESVSEPIKEFEGKTLVVVCSYKNIEFRAMDRQEKKYIFLLDGSYDNREEIYKKLKELPEFITAVDC